MNARKFKVFIGSPTDTKSEREIVDEVIDQINDTLGRERNILVEAFKWEKSVIPDVGNTPQDVINKQGDGFDIFVGLMWNKYGTKGANGMSPSEEEYDIAYKSFKNGGSCKRILYFCNEAPIKPKDIDVNQITYIRAFHERLTKDGVFYKSYNGIEDFKKVFHVALYQALTDLLANKAFVVNKNGLRGKTTLDFDKNTKLLYDSLLMSPRVGKIKKAFVESYVQLYLYNHKDSSVKEICDYLEKTIQYPDRKFYENVVSTMKRDGLIDGAKQFHLTSDVEKAIESIVNQAAESEKLLLEECEDICRKFNISLDSSELYNNISRLFDECYDIDDVTTEEEPSNKQQIQGKVTDQLVVYISKETGLSEELSTNIATEFVSACCNNPIFDKCSTSKMFLNLFKQDKLEQYMSQTTRHLFLDTQVLLQIVCTLYTNDTISLDDFYTDGRLFWNSVKSNNLTRLYTTNCYVDELVGNMLEAQRVASFLRYDLQELFGESNNVFLRDFLRQKKLGLTDSIEKYFSDLLDIDEDEVLSDEFQDIAYNAIVDLFENVGIQIEEIPFYENYDEYRGEYQKALYLVGYEKKDQTLSNDLNAILYMSDFAKKTRQIPYLVTRDNSFIKVRKKIMEKIPSLSFWHIHSPLRVANMLSVMTLKLNPAVVNRNIVSIVEKSFDTHNSDTFLDVMANYVDKSKLNEWEFAKKMKNLKKSLEEKNVSDEGSNVNAKPAVEDYFNYLIKRYSNTEDEMDVFVNMFADNDYADVIISAVKDTIEGFFANGDNSSVNKQFDKLIKLYRYSHTSSVDSI